MARGERRNASWEDFLYGLGQAGPQIANMLYNHAMHKDEKELREKEFAL